MANLNMMWLGFVFVLFCSFAYTVRLLFHSLLVRVRGVGVRVGGRGLKITVFMDVICVSSLTCYLSLAYSSSYNLTPPISRVLISRQLIFYLPTWPTCCNSPRKYTPVTYKARQKAEFPIAHINPPGYSKN